MFARVLVQECQPGTVEMLCREAERTLIDRLRGVPGFVSYKVLKVDDRSLVAMGFFETRAGAEQMEEIGSEWRRTIGKDAIVSAVPYIGEILLDAGPAPGEMRQPPQELHPSV